MRRSRPGGLKGRAGRAGSATTLAVALGLSCNACSNVDRDPNPVCEEDSDCGAGSVCALVQGNNICVPDELPPQTVLGFDIEDTLHFELTGCDPEVSRELGGSELRVQKRGSLIKAHDIRTTEIRSVLNCADCEGTCDEVALTCTEPSDTSLELRMRSRLGLWGDVAELESESKPYMIDPEGEGELPDPVSLTWPSYDADNAAETLAALRLLVTPIEAPTRSRYWRVLAADAPSELETSSLTRCQRAIVGNEGSVRTIDDVPIAEAVIDFLYNEPIATPATVIGTPPSCAEPGDCPPGWACHESGTCGLDLSGEKAGTTTSLADPIGGFPPAYLYTYCEGIVASMEPLVRKFRVKVSPPKEMGLPSADYELEQEFYDPLPNTLVEVTIQNGLCLPAWQPPQPVAFSLSGKPVPLTETELGVYSCCTTACLPSTDPEVEPTPPPTIDSCQSADEVKVSFETKWFNDELAWPFAECIPTATASDGSSGSFVREIKVADCGDEGCVASLTIGEADEDNRNYTVSVFQPAESVFRSQRFNVSLTPGTTEFPTFVQLPRVLLRGQIVCATGNDNCSAQNAIIAAERLRTEDDTNDLPGPFYFRATVDVNGNFVLPVDPGLYVVTAYPAIGQPGGPARFQVLDLREDSELVDEIDGVPHAVLPAPLELDDGVLVRVQLRDFPVSTGVRPIDIGSWAYQNDFPDDIDLNAPQTCLGSSTSGCQIRRIRNNDTAISLLISGSFQFTARNRGGDECPAP